MSEVNNLFRLIVDYVYEEILKDFFNNDGECNYSTFSLINWSVIIDNKSGDGLY